jgi:hypothetical protein
MAFINIIIALLFLSFGAQAQTFAEWFNQKSTQKKYLLQQIAALQAYGAVLKTGYNVAHNGLGTIGSFNNREFHWHSSYYAALKTVSPALKNNSRVKDILQWQQDINTASGRLKNDPYYNSVKAAVLKDCNQQLTELQKLLADNSVEMSDADRLQRLYDLYTAMRSNYRFTIGFCNNAQLIEQDKNTHPKDIQNLRTLYGTH